MQGRANLPHPSCVNSKRCQWDWSDANGRERSPSGNTWIPFFWLLFCAEAVLSPGNLGPSALDVLLLVEFKFYKRKKKKKTFLILLHDVEKREEGG